MSSSRLTSDTLRSNHDDHQRDEESSIEGHGLSRTSEDIISPVFVHPCSIHPGDPCREELELFADPGERIKIIVGTGPSRKTFLVHKRLLCLHSEYFKTALKEGNHIQYIEAETGEFKWPEDDPENVHRWVRWLYSCSSCRVWGIYDPRHVCHDDPTTWCGDDVEAEQAFVFGDRIFCPAYCMFALSSFIQHVHLIHPSRIIWAYENTPDNSTLHRFIAHWLAWTKFRFYKKSPIPADDTPATDPSPPAETKEAYHEYTEIFTTLEGWTSIDPRNYFMAHWSAPCSRPVYARCPHKRVCHFFASQAATYFLISGPDETTFRLGFQLEHQRRRQPDRRTLALLLYDLSYIVWFISALINLILAPYLFARANGQIPRGPRIAGVVASVLGWVGYFLCRNDLRERGSHPWRQFAFPVVVCGLVGGIGACGCHATVGCFKAATVESGVSMCKIQAGLVSMEMFYAVILAGLVVGYWVKWLPIRASRQVSLATIR